MNNVKFYEMDVCIIKKISWIMLCVWNSSEVLLHLVSGVENVKFFKYKELQHATDNFSQLNKIGEGGFGLVYKVTPDVVHL